MKCFLVLLSIVGVSLSASIGSSIAASENGAMVIQKSNGQKVLIGGQLGQILDQNQNLANEAQFQQLLNQIKQQVAQGGINSSILNILQILNQELADGQLTPQQQQKLIQTQNEIQQIQLNQGQGLISGLGSQLPIVNVGQGIPQIASNGQLFSVAPGTLLVQSNGQQLRILPNGQVVAVPTVKTLVQAIQLGSAAQGNPTGVQTSLGSILQGQIKVIPNGQLITALAGSQVPTITPLGSLGQVLSNGQVIPTTSGGSLDQASILQGQTVIVQPKGQILSTATGQVIGQQVAPGLVILSDGQLAAATVVGTPGQSNVLQTQDVTVLPNGQVISAATGQALAQQIGQGLLALPNGQIISSTTGQVVAQQIGQGLLALPNGQVISTGSGNKQVVVSDGGASLTGPGLLQNSAVTLGYQTGIAGAGGITPAIQIPIIAY